MWRETPLARPLALTSLILLASGCGAAPPRLVETHEAVRYTFEVSAELDRLEAEICFEGAPPPRLRAIHAAGVPLLIDAWTVEAGQRRRLPVRGRSIELTGAPRCIRYAVDLERAARAGGGMSGATRLGDSLVAATSVWLWGPSPISERAVITARFVMPEGMATTPLWALEPDGSYRLDARAFRFIAYGAFGRFERRRLSVPGACLEVSLLGPGLELGFDGLERALGQSALAASMLFGRFPVDAASLLVIPVPYSAAVPFGVVGRGTLPTVALFVGAYAEEEAIAAAWVPVHELGHLATPFIAREDAWLSEGLATYYQEVLRARAGSISAEEAWRHLDHGFRTGAADGTGRTLDRESADMMRTAAFRRVYWAGAALALIADVELRRRGGSLDQALDRLRRCCADAAQPMSAREVLAILDEAGLEGGSGVFGPIAEGALGETRFPDLGPTYERLGIVREGTAVTFTDDDSGAALRAAIMAAPPSMALSPTCE